MNKVIALEKRLNKCKNVMTLGLKSNFYDYTDFERRMIAKSKVIYFPSRLYVGPLAACGKKVFPNFNNYEYAQDKIKQTLLYQINRLPHPKTRFFYGRKQKNKILNYFRYPFIAKIPRGSAKGKGVYLINNKKNLDKYLAITQVAYIQKYMSLDKDIRVILVGNKIIHAYWRIIQHKEFRGNISIGSDISFGYIPYKALKLAYTVAMRCGWDDVGIDICYFNGQYYVLEANMKYGYEGFSMANIDYFKLMEDMIKNEQI